MRTISFKGLRFVGEGSFGSYYRISARRGVKVFFTELDSKADLLGSYEYHQARKEFDLLKKAEKVGITPKPYELVLLKDKWHGWCVGIVMQHLNKSKSTKICYESAESNLKYKLSQAGIRHYDLHDKNIIPVKRGDRFRYYAIDFSPGYVEIDDLRLRNFLKRK